MAVGVVSALGVKAHLEHALFSGWLGGWVGGGGGETRPWVYHKPEEPRQCVVSPLVCVQTTTLTYSYLPFSYLPFSYLPFSYILLHSRSSG